MRIYTNISQNIEHRELSAFALRSGANPNYRYGNINNLSIFENSLFSCDWMITRHIHNSGGRINENKSMAILKRFLRNSPEKHMHVFDNYIQYGGKVSFGDLGNIIHVLAEEEAPLIVVKKTLDLGINYHEKNKYQETPLDVFKKNHITLKALYEQAHSKNRKSRLDSQIKNIESIIHALEYNHL